MFVEAAADKPVKTRPADIMAVERTVQGLAGSMRDA